MVDVISFAQALEAAPAKKHLLLGNGFSIALRPDIFSYESLFKRADFKDVPRAADLFKALNTHDFEAVIRVLVSAAKLLQVYGAPAALIEQFKKDAAALKSILVTAIGKNHPDRPFDVKPEQYAACRDFLAHFHHIYTLNYDILLYWALMQTEVDKLDLRPDDGFRHPEEEEDATYVSWIEAHSPTIYFLHGALHLFDDGSQIIKYTWSKTDIPLLDQIRDALEAERYPLFVAEGQSKEKLTKILHNAYLHKALRSFQSICTQRNAAMFIYGHSLSSNDNHVLRQISRESIGQLYVSLYGDPGNQNNKAIIAAAEGIVAQRQGRRKAPPLTVTFFAAESAHVWG